MDGTIGNDKEKTALAQFNIKTHLGELKSSSLEILSCVSNPETDILPAEARGILVAANGGELNFRGTSVHFSGGTGSGQFEVTGETGSWKDVDGWLNATTKTLEAGNITFRADGRISPPAR